QHQRKDFNLWNEAIKQSHK
ncbi:hypothetical protein CCACVL1_01170, partial [Corchorus capsularis]